MLTASVYVDLSADPASLTDSPDRFTLARLAYVPNGARVTVYVGSRQFPTIDAACWLHEHGERLHIEIQGDTAPITQAWLESARTGNPLGAWEVAQ